MAGNDQHVLKRGDGWCVRGEADAQDTSRHATVAQAIEAARRIAEREKSEIYIHGPGRSIDEVTRPRTHRDRRRAEAS